MIIIYFFFITMARHAGVEYRTLKGPDAILPYVFNDNARLEAERGDGVENMALRESQGVSTFFNMIDESFEQSFGDVYDDAIHPHVQARRHVHDSRGLHPRQFLRDTKYIHANMTYSGHGDKPVQICTHRDANTSRMHKGRVPVAWVPVGPKPPSTMFGFPTLGKCGIFLDVRGFTLTLMNDSIPHGSSSFDLECEDGSAMYGVELGVNKKVTGALGLESKWPNTPL